MRALVRAACPPGGVVLDPFAGSGTTLVACSLEGRRGIGFELEPENVRIANDRLLSVASGQGAAPAAGQAGLFAASEAAP